MRHPALVAGAIAAAVIFGSAGTESSLLPVAKAALAHKPGRPPAPRPLRNHQRR